MSLLGATMSGDIWSTGAFSFESPLKDLLDTGDYTLEQLLAEDELLQELRGVHAQLINFFSTPESVTKLVQYVILPIEQESNGDAGDLSSSKPGRTGRWLMNHIGLYSIPKTKTPEKDPFLKHIRFPYMACEIICCEIVPIIDILVDGYVPEQENKSGEETATEGTSTEVAESSESGSVATKQQPQKTRILDLLFSLLYDTEPGQLDDYRAGYFDKILTVLFRRRPEELAKFINEGGCRGTDVLMNVMFSHLYAHSIMQIAQRLMLPQRPQQPPPPPSEENGAEIIEAVAPEDEPSVICDWSKSSKALNWLLDCLINPQVPAIADEQEREERRLDLSLNASEVLITIIQNSMLSSDTMLSLTSSETIQRLVEAATTLHTREGEEPFFSPHESLLTSAMTVLESLILQLGGYGAVGTMFLLPEEEEQQQQQQSQPPQQQPDQPPEQQPEQPETDEPPQQLIADLSSMVCHLPLLLDSLSALLRHPSTKLWTAPMQYSKTEPQQLLGSSRLRIIRVVESLVLLGDPEVDSKLVQSDCLEIALDLFWEFQWCSMLHQSVANLLVHVFEGQNARMEMQEYFLVKCNLLGRLMESFNLIQESPRIVDVVTNIDEMNIQSDNDKSSSADALPISEDDVEAAMEKQQEERVVDNVEQTSTEAVRFDSRETSIVAAAPPQAFRLGYMGHVIIICQALVHACSTEMEQDEQQIEEFNQEPLALAEIVASHVLADRWNDFVATTLASETAIQSTPLGGYAGTAQEPLLMHRPGLADDGDIMGDDGTGPPAPPRSMLAPGEVLDMDDNDLEVAASMMANLSMQRPAGTDGDSDSGSQESGDSEKSYNSGESNSERTGYAFDDPLGKAGALGIELGKLTQYQGDDQPVRHRDAKERNEEEEEDDDNSSSDEEEPQCENKDVPVMDLFAGNFDYSPNQVNAAPAEWSNFANFEQAEEAFGEFTSATPPSPPPSQVQEQGTSSPPATAPDVEAIFVKTSPVLLLDVSAESEGEPTTEVVYTGPTAVPMGTDPEVSGEVKQVEPDAVANALSSAPLEEENPEVPFEQDEIVSAPSDELSADEEAAVKSMTEDNSSPSAAFVAS